MRTLDNKALDSRLQEFVSYAELKQLTYNIAALQQQKMFYSLAVLSFFPAEGKTLACAALAMAYADTFRSKVLIVDTTTFQNKKSVALKQCLGPSQSLVDVMSMKDLRNRSAEAPPRLATEFKPSNASALETEVVRERPMHVSVETDNDFSLLKRVTTERSDKYGLVLLDTSPMTAKNKNNIDPLLVARLSDAAALVVSRKLLKSPTLNACLKVLTDPTLHLIGMMSNEVHPQ